MINWREGKNGFVGGSKRLIRGVLSYGYTETSVTVSAPISEICKYYVPKNHSIRSVTKELFKGDAGTFLFDCTGWGSVTSSTWTVIDGNATITNNQVLSDVVSANISLDGYGDAEINLQFTDGTRTKSIRLYLLAGDLDKPDDYWDRKNYRTKH